MDQHTNPDNQGSSLFGLNLDAQNSYNLRAAASWARVLGVCGFLIGIIIIIYSIYALSTLSSYEYSGSRSDSIFGNPMAATKGGLYFFVLVGLIFLLGGGFSFTFGKKIMAALRSNDQTTMNQGFASLRNYFATRGITLIILLLLLLLSILGSAM